MSPSTSTPLRTKLRRLLYLRNAVTLVWQSTPRLTVASISLALVQSLLPVITLYTIKLIIDAVSTGLAATGRKDLFGAVLPLVLLACGVALFGELCKVLAGFISEAQTLAVTNYVQNLLHAKSIELDLEYYENASYYDALHRAQAEATYRPGLILERLVITAQNGLALAAIAVLLVALNWVLALILFLALLPGVFLRIKYARSVYRQWNEWTPRERKADYFDWLLTREEYAKEVRLFNLGALLQNRYRSLRQEINREKVKLAAYKSLIELITRFSLTLAVFAALGFMAYQTLEGAITLGGLVMYYQAFQRGQGLLQESLSSVAVLYENSFFLANFYEFLGLKPKVLEPLDPRPMPVPLKQGIEFKHVSFHYPNSTRPLLEDLSFTIRAGETVAIVGENGAGKTTLVKLLCRLYDPTSGQINLDGINLREFETTALRQQFSVVFQDYARYNLTALENIGFGNVTFISESAKIKAAAAQTGADRVIEKLPKGYDTTLGNLFEEGEELSIGQWQKVAIARAFMRDAAVIVLDEPTSALDPQAEFEVFEHFRQLATGRTALIISHRLSTVQLADRILVLKDGRISENGSHNELLALGGTYARLFKTQAQYYR